MTWRLVDCPPGLAGLCSNTFGSMPVTATHSRCGKKWARRNHLLKRNTNNCNTPASCSCSLRRRGCRSSRAQRICNLLCPGRGFRSSVSRGSNADSIWRTGVPPVLLQLRRATGEDARPPCCCVAHPRAFTLISSGLGSGHPQRIAQGPAKAFDRDLHHVSILHPDSIAEAEAVRPEEMNVNVSRAAMGFVFEVMMFNVCQAVTHLILAAAECFPPKQGAGAFDLDFYRHGLEARVHRRAQVRARRCEAWTPPG